MQFYSKSRIFLYLSCPYAYYLTYVKEVEIPPSYFATKGGLLHLFFQHLPEHYEYKDNKLLPTFFVSESLNNEINNILKVEKIRLEKYGEDNFKPIVIEQEFKNPELRIKTIVDRIEYPATLVELKPRATNNYWEELAFSHLCVNHSHNIEKWKVIGYNDGKFIETTPNYPLVENMREKVKFAVKGIESNSFPKKHISCAGCYCKDFCNR